MGGVNRVLMTALLAPAALGGVQPAPSRLSIEGVWNFSTLTPLERPAEFANRAVISDAEAAAWANSQIVRDDRDRRDGGAALDVSRAVNDYWFDRGTALARGRGGRMTSLIVDPPDGRMPALTPAARTRVAAAAAAVREHPSDGPEDRSLQERCLSFNAGPPMLPGVYNNIVEIEEMPGYIVIFNEMIHEARLVPLADSRRTPPVLRRWQGVPRGRWDGPTLVVDSTGFLQPLNLRGADAELHLIERFSPLDANTLLYSFTVDDATAYARPWTAEVPMTRTNDRIFEYACHEGNYALPDILRGARYEDSHR